MVTYKQLKKEFDEKVLELQGSCKHKHLSPWMDVCWAPGHYTGSKVRLCNDCNKKIYEEKSVMK